MNQRFWAVLGGLLVLSRLCHLNILWADEDYHLAAAIQMLHGKMLYRDLWYDKPPLAALVALLFGGWPGWPLRIAGSAVAIGSCVVAWHFAAGLWGRREGFLAAGLLAFFQIFYLPAAVLPLEPDTLMILPHLLAVYWAWRGRALLAGLAASAAFLLTPKGVFVLIAALLLARASRWKIAAGFVIPCALAAVWLLATGAFNDYIQQVLQWGWLYASTPGADPQAGQGIKAVLNWAGFHSALVIGAGWYFWKSRNWPFVAWATLSLIAVALGGRFAPRYFDQLLPVLVICAAAGLAMLSAQRIALVILAIALAVPAVRFGPRYFQLASEDLRGISHSWTDVAMDQESRLASEVLAGLAKSTDTIFIWGYRPNIAVYTRLPVESRFWDSQPITGVPADRHLSDSRPVAPDWAERNRRELIRTHPTFLIDGLSEYNPDLSPENFPDLAGWLRGYCLVSRAGNVAIYRACAP